ncbi:hypothetical protein F971_01511 [Acinetobacter vivianii]|uniref:HTH luxR-type domain-containing protein n=1 Tax=Acinetobacter vivianii TaxID=1776742 RepID=N8WC70_9GAMM|nr:hypothetical protein [Acinetobacter vivianii]ENU92529.1 hypothetical protein F971_01511 [Acinetobacter vivianii]
MTILNKKKIGRPRKSFRRTTGGWWDCELNVLCSMIEDNMPIPLIAEVLDRSIFSVHTKIRILNLKSNSKAA